MYDAEIGFLAFRFFFKLVEIYEMLLAFCSTRIANFTLLVQTVMLILTLPNLQNVKKLECNVTELMYRRNINLIKQ